MLEPEYFQDKCDRMVELFRELEDYILNDIAQRMLKSGMSGTADRLIWKLAQMGEHRAVIMEKLSKITMMSRRELRGLLQEAVLTSWDDDLSTFNRLGVAVSDPLKNPAVRAVMDAEYYKSRGELENLTRTTMDKSQRDLVRMLDEAELRVASGVQSYSSAICDILDNYASAGVKVSYPTGTERTLESAVRMAVVTSMNQTSAQVTNQYIVEGNIEYVLVSAHLGARPQKKGQPYLAGHENWQGRVYRIRGSEEGFPNLAEQTGYDITEDGIGRVIDPLGLHGYNCRHSHKPWDKDLRNPYLDENGNLKIDTKESRKLYELQQKQRAMERGIRKTKRELLAKQQEINNIAETDVREILQPQYDALAHKLRQQNKAYDEFCGKNKLQKQYDRIKAAGFKRKQAAMANGRATVYANQQKKMQDTAAKETDRTPIEKAVEQKGKTEYNTVRDARELRETAETVRSQTGKYTDRESKWSGRIVIDNTLMQKDVLGQKEWNCDIALVDTADDGVVWHEMLHSCSVSHYTPEVYQQNRNIEEASVEFLKQQICLEREIDSAESYANMTGRLKALNHKFNYGTDMEFAKELFSIPLPDRYQWLEDKVDRSLRDMNASFENFYDVMHFVQKLKGGEYE